MKIRTKILSRFLVTALFAVILGVTGIVSAWRLTSTTHTLHDLLELNDGLTAVLNAHYAWRQALTDTVLAGKEFTGALDPGACALGQWYKSEAAKNVNDPQIIAMLEKLREPHDYIHNEAKITIAMMQAGEDGEAIDHLNRDILPKTAEVISILTDIQTRNMSLSEGMSSKSADDGKREMTLSISLTVAALIVSVAFAFVISASIAKPIIPLAKFMHKAGTTGDIIIEQEDAKILAEYSKTRDEIGQCIAGASAFIRHVTNISDELALIAKGDLTSDVELLSDMDKMGHSLRNMADSLNLMFGEINESTTQVSFGASQVAAGAQNLAQGAAEQASSIQELSGHIAMIAGQTRENAETAGKTANLADRIMANAEKGSLHMKELTSAVEEIEQASKEIGKIIKVIDEIAFQTNILALNAAVEASHAGALGKGFAVVAEEVRNLAIKSADAAKETETMIENTISKAERGARIAIETAESLADIVCGISESSRLVQGIAASSEGQSHGITQINASMDQVAQVVRQNSATAEESAAASEEMSAQSIMLKELISTFKCKDNNLNKAAAAEIVAFPVRTTPVGLPLAVNDKY